jgi:enoyl-CoA hydratase
LAARSAVFGTPVCRIGSLSTGGSHERLARVIGAGRALHMVLCGESIDAETAHRIGLVSAVFDDGHLPDETQRLATRIAGCHAPSVRATKRAFRFATDRGFEAALAFEEDLAVELRDDA